MWYRIALGVAGIIILTATLFAWLNRNIAEDTFRQHLRDLKKEQRLPPEFQDIDIETADLTEFDAEVHTIVVMRQDLSTFLLGAFVFWVPLVIGLCLGVTWLIQFVIGHT